MATHVEGYEVSHATSSHRTCLRSLHRSQVVDQPWHGDERYTLVAATKGGLPWESSAGQDVDAGHDKDRASILQSIARALKLLRMVSLLDPTERSCISQML